MNVPPLDILKQLQQNSPLILAWYAQSAPKFGGAFSFTFNGMRTHDGGLPRT